MIFKLRNGSRATNELNSQLGTIVSRLQLASSEKSASVDQNTYFVTKLLKEDPLNAEIAMIRAEGMIRDEKLINVYEILEAQCELLTENSELIEHSKSCPPDLVSCISSLVYASERMDIDAMTKLRKHFKKKYGSKFVENAKDKMHDQRIVSKLSILRPTSNEVHAYLKNICQQHSLTGETVTALPVGYAYNKEVSAMKPPPPSNPSFNASQLGLAVGTNNCNLLPSVTGTRSTRDGDDGFTRPFTSATDRNISSNAMEAMNEESYKKMFEDWLATLKLIIGSVDGKGSLLIPAIGGSIKEEFDDGLTAWNDADHEKNSSKRNKKMVYKNKSSTAEDKANASATVEEKEEALELAKESCQKLAQPILTAFAAKYDEMKDLHTAEIDEYETVLCQCAAICRATPKKLAAYCARSEENNDRVMRLFRSDTRLLKHIMINGDASPEFYDGDKQGLYGEVMENYENIMKECPKARMTYQSSDTTSRHLYNRLAIACACEFAIPVEHFDRPDSFVQPTERYLNYEKAYDNGLLDLNFDSFTTWELRMVVNSDLPDSELDWLRSMEMNYRPDLTITDDKYWIYTRLVKSDARYKNPPKREDGVPYDIMQHFSGGGKCGPRARMGRALCKAFGIPTWGAKVPRHTYLSRWTSKKPDMEVTDPDSKNHWTTNLGAKNPIYFSWGPKRGTDFFIETQLRERYRAQQEVYGRRVCLFEWLSCIEDGYFVTRQTPRKNEVYYCLTECQKAYLYENEMGDEDYIVLDNEMEEYNSVDKVNKNAMAVNQFAALKNREDVKEVITSKENGIIVPASIYEDDKSTRKGVSTMKSYLGGNQILLEKSSMVTYKLPAELTIGGSGIYKLSCVVCTIHASQISKPFALTVSSTDDDAEIYGESHEIAVPYTVGKWKTTVPITVGLHTGKEMLIKLTRSGGPYTVSMKEIRLEEIRTGPSPTNSNQMTSRHLNLLSGLISKDSYMNGQLNFGINSSPAASSIHSSSNRGIYGSSTRKEKPTKTTKETIMSVFRKKKTVGPVSTIPSDDREKKININSDFDFGLSNVQDETNKKFSMNGGLNLGVTIM